MNSSRASFTAADTMPIKLLQHKGLIESIVEKNIIPPIHVQFIPTNRCNLKCSFCSCDNEDRSLEMTKDQAIEAAVTIKNLGCEAVTITGGGEPLLWPHIQDLLSVLNNMGIKIGLVTNGTILPRQEHAMLNTVTWCRIS